MWVGLAGVIFGLFLLIWGSNMLIDGAAGVAKKKGIPGHVIGLTLVATATSLPEMATAITATISGSHDIAIGNVVGSNAFNLGMVLAIGAIIMPIAKNKATLGTGIIVLSATCIFSIFAVVTLRGIGRFEATLLLLLYLGYVIYLVRTTRFTGEVEVTDRSMGLMLMMLLAGFSLLFLGSPLLVSSAERLSGVWNIEGSVIAVTIIAAGTSLPELLAGVTAAVKGHEGIAMGNVLGSNLFNIMLIPGIAAMIHPLNISPLLGQSLIPAMLLITALTITLSYRKMGKKEGILLLISFVLFFLLTIVDIF